MHATDDAVECSLFKALIVQGIQIIGRVYILSTVLLKDIPEVLSGLEGFGSKRGILRGFGREAVLLVNGIPDLTGAHARVTGISFGVVDEADVVTFGSCSLILGHAVISLVTLIVIFKNTALVDAFTQLILQGTIFRSLSSNGSGRVFGVSTLEFTQFFGSPDERNVAFILYGFDGTGTIAAHGVLITPERTDFVVQVETIIGEEIGVLS